MRGSCFPRLETAEIHDAPYPGAGGRIPDVGGGLAVEFREVLPRCHRVDQVVDDFNILERFLQRFRIESVGADRLDPYPAASVQVLRPASGGSDLVALLHQTGDQMAPDIAGTTEYQYPCQRFLLAVSLPGRVYVGASRRYNPYVSPIAVAASARRSQPYPG